VKTGARREFMHKALCAAKRFCAYFRAPKVAMQTGHETGEMAAVKLRAIGRRRRSERGCGYAMLHRRAFGL